MTAAGRVASTDGVSLAYYADGDPDRPTVLAVHGYPDNHRVWDGVVALLAERFHVVTYDVRGAGDSDKPRERSQYRMEQLVDDLGAVLDAAVAPGAAIHLLAHDWGSVQCWPALTDARFAGRIASYTSISGPSLDHVGAWLRAGLTRHPRAALRQLLDSYYIALFLLPRLPEAAWRSGALDRLIALTDRVGRSSSGTATEHERSHADKINGLELYRANIRTKLGNPEPRQIDLPVQVLAPTRDRYVSPAVQAQAPQPYVRELYTRLLAGGHWMLTDRADVIARCVTELAEHVDGGPSAPGLARARSQRSGPFGGKLVVVTGGGRGIGRACALEFARQGADLIVADLDEVAAQQTADAIRGLGAQAIAYQLDVADGAGWERFAEWVRNDQGTADVIVNNAGIGMGGPFLSTSTDDWEKILGINLWGVIHGSRLFAAQLVERGEGGHIVNIASAAAYTPSRSYPAYATTKAAVLMLTECLRAELGRDGIGVSAICPGFVDTDISRTTLHVGVDADTQDRLRAHAVASYARRNYTPERLAKHVVRAVALNKPIAAITAESKVFRAITRLAPALGRQFAKVDLNAL